MNNREAHCYLEELQRMMTEHRGIFSEEFVCANGMAIQALEQIQSVDVEPVCRCEQCKWWDEDGKPDGRRWCYLLNIRLEPEFWCAYGERKEE